MLLASASLEYFLLSLPLLCGFGNRAYENFHDRSFLPAAGLTMPYN